MPFPFQTENEQIKSWDAIVIIISCDIMQDIYLQLHLFLTTFTMALPLDNQNVNVAKIKGRENICLLSYILQNRIQNDERKTLMGKMSDWLLAYGNCEESLHLQHSCHQQPFQNKIEHEIHLPIKCAWDAVIHTSKQNPEQWKENINGKNVRLIVGLWKLWRISSST